MESESSLSCQESNADITNKIVVGGWCGWYVYHYLPTALRVDVGQHTLRSYHLSELQRLHPCTGAVPREGWVWNGVSLGQCYCQKKAGESRYVLLFFAWPGVVDLCRLICGVLAEDPWCPIVVASFVSNSSSRISMDQDWFFPMQQLLASKFSDVLMGRGQHGRLALWATPTTVQLPRRSATTSKWTLSALAPAATLRIMSGSLETFRRRINGLV